MKSTPPPTLTKDYAFLSAVPSWTAKRGTATSAFLVSNPLKRQTSFLCTGSATFCCVFFPFKPSCYYVQPLLRPVLGVFTCWLRGTHRFRPVCNKHVYVKSLISVRQCRYHLFPGCSLSVLSRRCCLYLKHSSCSLWFPYYSLLVDHEARCMKLWAGGILPLHIKQVKEGIDALVFSFSHDWAISLFFF